MLKIKILLFTFLFLCLRANEKEIPVEIILKIASHSINLDFTKNLCEEILKAKKKFKLYLVAKRFKFLKDEFKKIIAKTLQDENIDNLNNAFLNSLEKKYFNIAQILLLTGAKINFKDEFGNTALIIGSRDNRPDVIEFLLKHGAHVNEVNNNNSNALILATRFNNNSIAKMLLKAGANFTHKNFQGYSALNFAYINRNFKILFLISKIYFAR